MSIDDLLECLLNKLGFIDNGNNFFGFGFVSLEDMPLGRIKSIKICEIYELQN